MLDAPKGVRFHIVILGRRNVGKSSLMNAITKQSVSIVSNIAGTTTDPVEKAMELLPLGPVLFIDTAGIDDEGALGEQRVSKTIKTLDRADLALVVVEPNIFGDFEKNIIELLKKKNTPFIVVVNKTDIHTPSNEFKEQIKAFPNIEISASCARNIDSLLNLIISAGAHKRSKTIIGDIVQGGDIVVLVVPIDLQAPKGRLILPQVQTIRDALDNDVVCVVVKERELKFALSMLKEPPKLIVCDSQCVLKTVADAPQGVLLTTFSILMARLKGDLEELVKGAKKLEKLSKNDRVLIVEACTHHDLEDDIARVKIPRWLRQYCGFDLPIDFCSGKDYPDDLCNYSVIIHCGGCTLNETEMLSRIKKAKEAGVPITNFGVAISVLQGVLERSLEPFAGVLSAYEELDN